MNFLLTEFFFLLFSLCLSVFFSWDGGVLWMSVRTSLRSLASQETDARLSRWFTESSYGETLSSLDQTHQIVRESIERRQKLAKRSERSDSLESNVSSSKRCSMFVNGACFSILFYFLFSLHVLVFNSLGFSS